MTTLCMKHLAVVLTLSFVTGIWLSVSSPTPVEAQSWNNRKRQQQIQRVPVPSIQTTPARDYSVLKIVPPPTGGLYLGQYEWVPNDISTFEAASGRKTALWSKYRGSWATGYDTAGQPHFDVQAANLAWQEGKVILIQAYNTYPGPGESEAPAGFTVDKLLNGTYDVELRRFAGELRQYGKPVFFTIGREPNGIGADYFGGFGPAGDKSLQWALENRRGFAEFNPSSFPYASLYTDVGTPQVCDGVERLKAAQRYYYDFFVRREGLKFLTFDTMGWAIQQLNQLEYDINDLPATIDKVYARQLLLSCNSFANFYPGDAYVDWVSLNFYMLDYYAKDWPGLTQDYVLPIENHFAALNLALQEVQAVARNKPVFFMELGFPDGMQQNSSWAAQKVSTGLTRILGSYPQINGFAMWSGHPSWMIPGVFPYDCLIRPGTQQGTALKNTINANSTSVLSCVYLSDGILHPNCVK